MLKRIFTTFPLTLTTACVFALVAACTAYSTDEKPPAERLQMGAETLIERDYDVLRGQRVGLIVNHTAQVGEEHLIDVLDEAEDVEVTALFGPEHGLRGEADAGEHIEDGRDTRTGAPVYSLYGETRQPTEEMLEEVDVLVFDIQDVGARFYTYISTMGLAMQAAAENNIPFVVLDRPNPLGGEYVSGFVLEEEQTSFVGQYPIPIAHGLTIGELARMVQGEGWLEGLEELELHVVPVEGWRRSMRWTDNGLEWPRPSPNLPTDTTALVYAGSCFFEATSASEGRGTEAPFQLLGGPEASGSDLAEVLNAKELPGVSFEAVTFTPRPMEGAQEPKLEGETLEGIRYRLTDAAAFEPLEAGIHVLHAFYHHHEDPGALLTRPDWLAQLAGTERLEEMLQEAATPEKIIAAWQAEVETFREQRAPYLLYE